MVKQFDVFWVNLDPTVGKEIKKVRPAVIVSPDELNDNLDTVIIAPLTSTIRKYPSRLSLTLDGKKGQVVLDQIRSVDKSRLKKKMTSLNLKISKRISELLVEIFET